MEILPAIDIRGGKCVRLRQGDFTQEMVFGTDPVAVAKHWVAEGAAGLHIVDLDGAKHGFPMNLPTVQAIMEAVSVPCELGGGIRNEDIIKHYVNLGLSRLVIGTLALREPEWFRKMCRQFPNRLVLGIDARNDKVATAGWLETSKISAIELAKQFSGEPIASLIYTDIDTDGMLAGPNVAAMKAMQQAVEWPVIASGGITSKEDIALLATIPMGGCIIGRALYEGTITLADAIAAAKTKG